MTSTAPLAKLSYSALVASLVASAIYIVFLAAPRLDWYWWLGFALFALPALVCVWGEVSYRWTTRPGHRYPAHRPSPADLQVIGGNGVPAEDRWAA